MEPRFVKPGRVVYESTFLPEAWLKVNHWWERWRQKGLAFNCARWAWWCRGRGIPAQHLVYHPLTKLALVWWGRQPGRGVIRLRPVPTLRCFLD